MEYRRLTETEIAALTANGCRAEDWSRLGVAEVQPAYFIKQDAKKAAPKVEQLKETPKPTVKVAEGEIAPEVLTAIGMALYLSTNLHDEESNVITIERRATSWNDKNYGVRHWKR